ncbi:MAG: glycosyltransferase family 2 protein [candidate division WOR-3 bacterium]|nr:MAG: glycosyltransferase family 2 protein [candidate division WOR-3 bacterium]
MGPDPTTNVDAGDSAGAHTQPFVSVAMITYNHERYVAQAIESVLMQETAFDYEVIIGEDCSTDGTRGIVADYSRKYPGRIRPLLHERNMGLHGMNNFIATLKACRGKYVAMLEGDDYWTDSMKLQKQVDFLERNSDFAVCGHWVRNVDTRGNLLDPQLFTCEDCPEVFGAERAMGGVPVHLGSCVARLSVLLSVLQRNLDVFRSLPAGDNPLLLMTLMQGKGCCLQEFMGAYRIQARGVYRSKSELLQRYDELLFRYSLPHLLGKDLGDSPRGRLDWRIRRGERNMADAISHCWDVPALLRLLRVMRASSLIPNSRIPAILLKVPIAAANRFAVRLWAVAPRAMRNLIKRYHSTATARALQDEGRN